MALPLILRGSNDEPPWPRPRSDDIIDQAGLGLIEMLDKGADDVRRDRGELGSRRKSRGQHAAAATRKPVSVATIACSNEIWSRPANDATMRRLAHCGKAGLGLRVAVRAGSP